MHFQVTSLFGKSLFESNSRAYWAKDNQYTEKQFHSVSPCGRWPCSSQGLRSGIQVAGTSRPSRTWSCWCSDRSTACRSSGRWSRTSSSHHGVWNYHFKMQKCSTSHLYTKSAMLHFRYKKWVVVQNKSSWTSFCTTINKVQIKWKTTYKRWIRDQLN